MKPLAANSLLQNRYLIIHHIGKGGMGEVYLAVDQRLGNPVALKRTVFRDDDMMWDAFEREARILARLRHSVLPKVSDHFSEKEEQYLVMEYISGDDLSKRLEASKKPFPIQWVLYWADELLDALHYLHTHEPPIIHRDIKPQNLKLTNENHVVLLDFGLAKNTVTKKAHLSSSGSLVGYTPNYAPIEQIRGTGTSARSDIYSLSATLYQLMTGTVPTDALTRAESVIGGTGDSLPSPTEIVPEISAEISAVILRGISLNSEQRYSDAKEMQRALREAYTTLQQQQEDFDGAETLIYESKAQPAGSISGGQQAAANGKEANGIFKVSEETPVTLTADALGEDKGILQPSEADFSATIPSDQWAHGETQGFTYPEIKRSTIDEEAFQKHGFNLEPSVDENGYDAASAASDVAPRYIEETVPPVPVPLDTVPDAAAAAEDVEWSDLDEKPEPIRPVTTPLDPAAKPPSSNWGIRLVGVAAVLCLLIAAGGAFGWYAVTNKLITIPGLEQAETQKPVESAPAENSEVQSSDKQRPVESAAAGDTVDSESAPASDGNADIAINPDGTETEQADELRPAGERKSNQASRSAANPQKDPKSARQPKSNKKQNSRIDILQ